MDNFAVDYDPQTWLRVPTSFPDGAETTAEQWAAREAGVLRDRGFLETLESGTLEQYLLDVVGAARESGEHDSFWALIDEQAPGFVAVVLDVDEATETLEDVLGRLVDYRPGEYEPASHTSIEATGLGEGVQVLRTDVDEQRQVCQSLYYVFRRDDTDYVVSTQMYDTAALAWAVPRINEFIDGITPGKAAES